jgi:hypothetical protein
MPLREQASRVLEELVGERYDLGKARYGIYTRFVCTSIFGR